jgi:CHAT domain-containing protein/Tfp pilus assembly protein PilF
MILPYSGSAQRKYRLWVVCCGLVLSVSLPLIQVQASPDALYVGKEVRPHAGVFIPEQEDMQARQLELGKPIERELAGGQSHSYQITLAADQYVKLVADQCGIDVTAKLFGPDGRQTTEIDSESRTHGEEAISWVAEEAGRYRLEVVAKYKSAVAGRYEIQLAEMRGATENDRALYKARKLDTEFFRLYDAGKYDQALPLVERVLEIRERVLGTEHPDVARALNNLAILYDDKADYAKAEPLFQRARAISEKSLGPEHPYVASILNNLAILYQKKGKYANAEPLFKRALAIREKSLGPEHKDVAITLNNLANFYSDKDDHANAEPLYQRALAISEKSLGPEHPYLASMLENLAILYKDRGYYDNAEPLFQRALAMREKTLGPEHPNVTFSLFNFALLYYERGDYVRAESLFQRVLTIKEKVMGPEHPDVATTLTNLAVVYYHRGDYDKAEPLFQNALAIREKVLGPEHKDVGLSLHNLATLYRKRGDYDKSELLFQRALIIKEKALGSDHPLVATTLDNLANLYSDRGDYATAEPFYQRLLAITEKSLGPEHPYATYYLNNFANFYRKRGDYTKAEPLYMRALAIGEKSLGPKHPGIAGTLNELAVLHAAKGNIAQAVTFLSRANAVDEHNFVLNLASGSERQKLAYLDIFSQRIDFTLSLHSRAAPNDPQALNLAFTTLLRRKARGLDAMTDTIATLRRHATPQVLTLFNQFTEALSRLAALKLKEPGTAKPDFYRTQVKQLEDKVDGLEGELSAHSTEFRKQKQPVTLAAVQAALPAGSTLVEFAFYTPMEPKTEKSRLPRYLAYLLPAQGQPKWVDLGEAALIDCAIGAWRNALRDPGRFDVKRLARAVDEKLMRPVRSLLSEMPSDTRHLLIAPDGSLNLIPFAALVDEQHRYLVERYSISYLISGRDLLRLQTSEPSKAPPMVVANPNFGRLATFAMRGTQNSGKSRTRNQPRSSSNPTQIFFQPLPATEDEALAIKALLPNASVLQREEATEAVIKQATRPQILHIATHGFFLNYQEPSPAKDGELKIVSPETAGSASAQAILYTVQLEATPALEAAQEKVKQIKAQGMDAYILKSEVKGKGTFFRIRVGNFPTQSDAQKYGADLQEKGIASEFFVARYEPPQRDLMEPAATIAGTTASPTNSRPVIAPSANPQPVTEPPSDLRLSKLTAQVKNPLLRSGLALAGANHGKSGDDDGVLTALEAAYLDLLGTKLVVLSACDTGVGEVKNGEGVQGLRRALVLAGSESQVMSLWPVADEATKDLMIPYYKALQQGEGRSEGLRQVQLRMLRGPKDRRHPFYWAAFIQSGEWANLNGQR